MFPSSGNRAMLPLIAKHVRVAAYAGPPAERIPS